MLDISKSTNFKSDNSFILFLKYKLIFTHIFKSGCESLRFLSLYENHQVTLDIINKWNWDSWCLSNDHIHSQNVFDKRNDRNKYEWITIVRNPITRIVSLYVNLLIKNKKKSILLSDILNCYNLDRTESITFEEFVEYIINKDRNTQNNHLRHQVDYIHYDFKNHIHKTKIFHLENINEINDFFKSKNFRLSYFPKVGSNISPNIGVSRKDFEAECKKKDFKKYVGDKNYSYFQSYIENHNIFPIYNNFLNDDLKNKLYEYYKDDFIYLGYDKK